MADSDNYALPSNLRVEMLINESNSLNLRSGHDYEFGALKPSYGTGLRYNTSLVLEFKGERLGVKERVFYRRLSLNYVKKFKSIPTFELSGIAHTTSEILHLLNEHYGTALTLDEVINDRFITNFDTSYECRVSDTSLAWNGGSLPYVVKEKSKNLCDILLVTTLSGLYPPSSLPINDLY